MAKLPTTESEFDTNLNRLNSLLQGLAVVKEINADDIGTGVFGASSSTSGIEFGISKTNSQTYIQARNFVSGSTGWQINSNGDVEFNSGTFRGSLSGNSITIGTNAWHVDTNGNMWWGSSSTYAGATIKISSGGLINGATFNATSGARISLSESTNEISIYYDDDDKSSIVGAENELRLRMEKAGGYVTLYSEDTEVLRADKQDGVTIPASLMLNAYRVSINKTGATAGIVLDIDNAGTNSSLTINQTNALNSDSMISLVNTGTGQGIVFATTNAANAQPGINFDHAGTGYGAIFSSTDNASRILPTVYIGANSSRGSHLHLEPIAVAPVSPSEGDFYTGTDNLGRYFGGTSWGAFANIAFGDVYSNTANDVTCQTQNIWYTVIQDVVGTSNLATPSTALHGITVLRTGTYLVNLTICVHSHASNHFDFSLFRDTTQIPNMVLHQDTPTAGRIENIAGSVIYALTAGEVIRVKVRCTDAAGKVITTDHVDLNLTMLR